MAGKLVLHLEDRDGEIYRALDLIPLTPKQIYILSQTWSRPFQNVRRARERLSMLKSAGRLKSFRYATKTRGEQSYYLLTPVSFYHLHGRKSPKPPKSTFTELSFTRQQHTRMLADIVVHVQVLAHKEGITLSRFARENEVGYETSAGELRDDGSFDLTVSGGSVHSFHVECDRHTRPLTNRFQTNSLRDMITKYEVLADEQTERFRVLFITEGNADHVRTFLTLAASEMRNQNRSLFYGITIEGFLSMRSLRQPYLLNHHLETVPLIFPHGKRTPGIPQPTRTSTS